MELTERENKVVAMTEQALLSRITKVPQLLHSRAIIKCGQRNPKLIVAVTVGRGDDNAAGHFKDDDK